MPSKRDQEDLAPVAAIPRASDLAPAAKGSKAVSRPKPPAEKKTKKKASKRTGKKAPKRGRQRVAAGQRSRTPRPYPSSSLADALPLGEALFRIGGGDRVRRLTLLEKMNRSPASSGTKMLITNSGKYGLTKGSYAAEWIEFTPEGKVVFDPKSEQRQVTEAKFQCAFRSIDVFTKLYEEYKTKRLPEPEVMRDFLQETQIDIPDLKECIDLFVVNAKDLGLLRTIAGAQTLIPIEQLLDEGGAPPLGSDKVPQQEPRVLGQLSVAPTTKEYWDSTCFYISPIGDEGSEHRRHSDLFLNSIVVPALDELKLKVVRADQISEPGMITTQVLEHLKKAKLVIADLSYLNPNVFYEMALRHASKRPIVQLIRKADKIPFDVAQVRTSVVDTTDIYALVPKIQTYISEVATLARSAIQDPEKVGNVVSVFYPDFWK